MQFSAKPMILTQHFDVETKTSNIKIELDLPTQMR